MDYFNTNKATVNRPIYMIDESFNVFPVRFSVSKPENCNFSVKFENFYDHNGVEHKVKGILGADEIGPFLRLRAKVQAEHGAEIMTGQKRKPEQKEADDRDPQKENQRTYLRESFI